MIPFSLKQIFLGEPDGRKEALYRPDFEKFFFDYQNIAEEAINPKNFLILGRKGSGKTILAEYIRKKTASDACHFCEIRSYKEFKFQELVHFKSKDFKPNEYISFWEWIILLDFARLTLQDNGITDNVLKAKLEKFYKDNYVSIKIDSRKVLEITKQNKISANAFNLGAEHGSEAKQATGSYLHYLEDLRDVVIGILKTSQSKYTVFYDELDDRFRDEDDYKHGVIGLIKATDKLNLLFLENGIKAKSVILLRTDIFSLLNDPDLNKVRMGNSIVLDWGKRAASDSPLFDLVLTKVRRSVPSLEPIDRESLFNQLFPAPPTGIDPARFLLERTFFRPRDVITYLNLIIKKYPATQYFSRKSFIDLMSEYSEYFFQEIRNELSGHLSDLEIDKGAMLLKHFNQHHFSYADITAYFNENDQAYKDIDLDKILKTFFKFSIIGNRWFNEFKNKNYYSWAYRDVNAELDFKKDMVIHLGLRNELSM